MQAVRVDPKVWFSAERTFLHWAKIAVVFAASATLLITSAGSAPRGVTYGVATSGTCGMPVVNGATCSGAAAEAGLTVQAARNDGHVRGVTDAPPYCYMEDGVLKFNEKGVNKGMCSEKKSLHLRGGCCRPVLVHPRCRVGHRLLGCLRACVSEASQAVGRLGFGIEDGPGFGFR
mmetsp:Transcript_167071/g.531401  ORF Transcript_167071/g.531401 Transcript_167071/m.531401 type:complete len:175 (+) Transcript_167071:72-596(+)